VSEKHPNLANRSQTSAIFTSRLSPASAIRDASLERVSSDEVRQHSISASVSYRGPSRGGSAVTVFLLRQVEPIGLSLPLVLLFV
jgi:hypothetical protein